MNSKFVKYLKEVTHSETDLGLDKNDIQDTPGPKQLKRINQIVDGYSKGEISEEELLAAIKKEVGIEFTTFEDVEKFLYKTTNVDL